MKLRNLLVPALALTMYACGSEPAVEEKSGDDNSIKIEINGEKIEIDSDDQKNLEEAINKSKDALNDLFGGGEKSGEKVEIVHFRDLKDFLPNKIGSLRKDDEATEGSTSKIAGFQVSQVEATYRDGDAQMDVQILDPGNASSIMSMLASWSQVEIDSESGNGYQRTVEYKGHKGYEEYDSKSREGSFAMMVDNRFLVMIDGENVDMDDMKSAIDDINIKKLARMAN